MNKDICQKCNRKLVFSGKNFYCIKKIDKNNFIFYDDPGYYLLTKSKWKKINSKNIFKQIFSYNKSKHINNLLKKQKICNVIFFEIGFACPYSMEHQLSDWNEK